MEREYEWMSDLDERQKQEIMFARLYAEMFHHGTDGHHRLMLITRMADKLNEAEDKAKGDGK